MRFTPASTAINTGNMKYMLALDYIADAGYMYFPITVEYVSIIIIYTCIGESIDWHCPGMAVIRGS
jgi:hypothetical protein